MINFPYLFGSISNSLMKNDLSQPNFWFDFTKKNYEFWNITLPCWPFSQNKVLLRHRTNYFSFLLLWKKYNFFLEIVIKNVGIEKSLKVILKKKDGKFLSTEKICKKQLLLVFFDSLSKTDTQTALNDSTTIINWKMLKELLIKKTHNDVIKKLMWPKKWLICEKNSSTFSLVPSNTIWRPFFIFL